MKQRATVVLVIAVLLLGLVIPLLHPGTASADVTSDDITSGSATYTFQDRAHIVASFGSDGQTTFTDSDVNDGTNNYVPDDNSLFCSGYSGTHISLPNDTNWGSSSMQGTLVTEVSSGQSCGSEIHQTISISNPNTAANYKYEWNGNNITTLPGQTDSATFTSSQNAPNYYADSNSYSAISNCSESAVVVASGTSNSGTLYCYQKTGGAGPRGAAGSPNCSSIAASADKAALPAAVRSYAPGCVKVSSQNTIGILGSQGSTPAGTAPSGSGSGTPSLGCHVGIGIFNPLNWLLCGAILGMSAIIGVLDRAISSQLAIGTDNSNGAATDIFGDSSGQCTASAQQSCNDYYTAWSSFRNIALGLMVLGGLIMLIAQARWVLRYLMPTLYERSYQDF
jgi:hypothetical protein